MWEAWTSERDLSARDDRGAERIWCASKCGLKGDLAKPVSAKPWCSSCKSTIHTWTQPAVGSSAEDKTKHVKPVARQTQVGEYAFRVSGGCKRQPEGPDGLINERELRTLLQILESLKRFAENFQAESH